MLVVMMSVLMIDGMIVVMVPVVMMIIMVPVASGQGRERGQGNRTRQGCLK
jgi:hypothetical protein